MFSLCLLTFITTIVCLSQVISFRRLYLYVGKELNGPQVGYLPRLAVILPCKGIDPGFYENIQKLLNQDYAKDGTANFEIIFAVASKEDPAYPILHGLTHTVKAISCRLIVAGTNPKRGQKINNQLQALKYVSEDTEVLVFVDSDVIARGDFLKYLVAPLKDSSVGVATGYRFYFPSCGNPISLVRALWNRMSAWEMANPKFAFAWGGAMAIRHSTFVDAKVTEHWDNACDDDLSLTTAVKQLGLKVHFVPQCLVASHGDSNFSEICEWMNRQLILTKVYYPKLWWRAIGRASIMAIWLLVLFYSVLAGLMGSHDYALPASLIGLSVLPIELVFLLMAQWLWKQVLADQTEKLNETFWHFCLAVPLAHLLLPWMTLFSILTNRIHWRGVTYELKSPTETVII